MPKVIFKFDKEKDLFNIWETCNSRSYTYGNDFKKDVTPNILKICEGKKYEECKEELEETMNYLYQNKIVNLISDLFSKAWESINEEYFKRLAKLMKTPFCTQEVKAYLTTSGRCPYDFNLNHPCFFTNFWYGIPFSLTTAAHELMHIQFHNSKYWDICKKEIGKEKTSDLKEALTILLNIEFKDLLLNEDRGYLAHKELRKFISQEWKKEKDFDKLIDKCIIYLKEN